jgi:hypothetical protein
MINTVTVSPQNLEITIIGIYDNDWYLENKNQFLNFCKSSLDKPSPATVNMYHDDWENKSNTLPYLIYKTDRFKNNNGNFYLAFYNDEIIVCSGVYRSSFDTNVAIANVRLYCKPEFRGKLTFPNRFISPIQTQWARDHNIKVMCSTLNDYNKRLIPILIRGFFGDNENPIHALDFPIYYNYTKQWVIYSNLDNDYVVNWEKIRYNGNDK